MKQLFLTTGIIFISFCGFTQSTPLTLKQAVEAAIANNAIVKQSEFTKEQAAVSLNQSKGNMIPIVQGQIQHYLNQGRSIDPASNGYINSQLTTANYNLGTSVILFNGFRLLNQLKQNQYAAEASRMDWQQSKDKAMLDVILAYLQVLSNTDQLALALRQADATKQLTDRLELMNKEGAIKPSDLYDLRAQFSGDQLSVITAQNALNTARVSLAQLMNTPYDPNLQVEPLGADQFDTNYGSNPDSIFNVAMQQLAIIKAVDLRSRAFSKALSAAKGNLVPSLGFGAGIATNYSSLATDAQNNKISYGNQFRNNYGTYLGATVNIPILNNFRFRNAVRLAKIDLKSAEFTDKTVKIQLKQNVERDYFSMTAALDRYKALVDQVAAYTESYRAAEIRFTQGVTTSVEYLFSKNNLDRAKSNLIIARYEYFLRIKILDYYQGKPLF